MATHARETRIQKGNLITALGNIERLQVDSEGRGLVLSYAEGRVTVDAMGEESEWLHAAVFAKVRKGGTDGKTIDVQWEPITEAKKHTDAVQQANSGHPGTPMAPLMDHTEVVYLVLVLLNFAWFWPIWTNQLLTHAEWTDRIWFTRWI